MDGHNRAVDGLHIPCREDLPGGNGTIRRRPYEHHFFPATYAASRHPQAEAVTGLPPVDQNPLP